MSEVSVRFGGVAALGGATLGARPGQVTGLIGPNGAGKTTLFNVISGLQRPDRGSVHFFAQDVTAMKPHRRARLGLARTFQRLELFGSLSAGQNVQVGLESSARFWQPARWKGIVPKLRRASTAPADELLSGVGLSGMYASQAGDMSTGSARMVELARALAIGPKLLLLDEPGSGLDETESTALGDLLVRLAADGMAVLLVEHDMELVMRVCDYIYVLDFGEVIASGTPDEVRANPAVQAAYLGTTANDGVESTEAAGETTDDQDGGNDHDASVHGTSDEAMEVADSAEATGSEHGEDA